jgi:hypothetical protein
MPKAQPQRGCPPSLYLMSPRNTIFAVQKFCIIGYAKSQAYSPEFMFLLSFIYGAAECGPSFIIVSDPRNFCHSLWQFLVFSHEKKAKLQK